MPASILSPSDIVLVTGANGFVASNVVQQVLKAGYKVRGTARSAQKLAVLSKRWNAEFGEGSFEAVVVEDLAVEGALDTAMQGVSAVAHVATDASFGTDPEVVIPNVIAMTERILASAKRTPSIKRVVLTSSSGAGVVAKPGVEVFIDETSWNEESKTLARTVEVNDPMKPVWVYYASKAEGEQAAWRFVKEEKPHFEFNSVLPNTIIGPAIDPSQPVPFIKSGLFEGNSDGASLWAPQYFVSVEDTALVHLGALTLPSTINSRLWTVSGTYNWDEVLDVFRKLYPSRKFTDNFQSGHDLTTIDNSKATEILKQLGHDQWTGLEESVERLVGRE